MSVHSISLLVPLLTFLLSCLHCAHSVGCLDNSGNPVDWFTLYKMPEAYAPHRKKHVFPPHLYMDARQPTWRWNDAGQTLNTSDQAVAHTLNQVYAASGSSTIGYFMYNDEKPVASGGAVTVKHGHAKGVLAVTKGSAAGSSFWLVHSVPKHPPPANTSYSYPVTGIEYGQHYLCISLGADDIDDIGYQLRLNDVWLYDSNWPSSLYSLSPNLTALSHSESLPPAPATLSYVRPLKTTPPAQSFLSFSKSAHFGKDLYDSLVAPYLRAGLLTETWNHGSIDMNLNSTCDTTYQVHNIEKVASNALGIQFPTFQDHSKLALSSSQYVCVGDINRQVPQLKRGGGTVCFYSPEASAQYNSLVADVQPCPPTSNLKSEL